MVLSVSRAMGHNGARMYKHVIVPFDGGLETRAVVAPAADLAWRCGAKLVIVSTTAISDSALRMVLKSQAISKSGADVDFWIDLDKSIGAALVDAARHRADPIVCISSRRRMRGVIRARTTINPFPIEVLQGCTAPVLVIGPETDVSRGLPLVEVVVPYDGSPGAAEALALAARWGESLRLVVHIVGTVEGDEPPPKPARPAEPTPLDLLEGLTGSDASGPVANPEHQAMVGRLEAALDAIRPLVPWAGFELIATGDPAAALVDLTADRPDTILVLPANRDQRLGADQATALGPMVDAVVRASRRAVLLTPPSVAPPPVAPPRSPRPPDRELALLPPFGIDALSACQGTRDAHRLALFGNRCAVRVPGHARCASFGSWVSGMAPVSRSCRGRRGRRGRRARRARPVRPAGPATSVR